MKLLALLAWMFGLVGLAADETALLKGARHVSSAQSAAEFKSVLAGLRPQQTAVVLFYTTWCPHCLRYVPDMIKLADDLSCYPYVKFVAIECSFGTDRIDVAQFFQVNGFPTLMIIHNDNQQPGHPSFRQWTVEGSLPRTADEMLAALKSQDLIPSDVSTCFEHRLTLPDDPSSFRNFETSKRWTASALKADPKARYHDAVHQLQTIMLEWVIDEELTYNKASIARVIFEELAFVTPDHDTKKQLLKIGRALTRERKITKDIKLDLMNLPGHSFKEGLSSCTTEACGLWMLIHTIAVNNALQPKPIRAQLVVDSLLAFIDEFFVCADCRKHFNAALKRGDADRHQWTSGKTGFSSEWGLSLWLWRFHNVVTYRTAVEDVVGDKNKTLLGQDLRFPPRAICRECYTNSKPFTLSQGLVDKCADEDECNYDDYERFEDFDLVAVRDWLEEYFGLPEFRSHK